MALKGLVRELTPPLVWQFASQARRQHAPTTAIEWTGDYPDYAAARAVSGGYEDPSIIETVVRRYREGYNAGGVIPLHTRTLNARSQRLLAALLSPASEAVRQNSLRVLDFGGEFGLHYWQTRPFLPESLPVDWTVIETPALAEAARNTVACEELRFLSDIPPSVTVDVVLTSGALQYAPEPVATWVSLLALRPAWIVLDRFPLAAMPRDRLTVQHVPTYIYQASYPAWFFAEREWEPRFQDGYAEHLRWDTDEVVVLDGQSITYGGRVLRRLDHVYASTKMGTNPRLG